MFIWNVTAKSQFYQAVQARLARLQFVFITETVTKMFWSDE